MKNIEVEFKSKKHKDDSFSITFYKNDGESIVIDYLVPIHEEPVRAVHNRLIRLFGLFANNPTNNDISNMISVNIVEYRRGRGIDVRYIMKDMFATTPLIKNTDFYVNADRYTEVFDIAIEQCIDDFYKLKSDLGGVNFITDLYEFTALWGKKHGLASTERD